MLLNPIQDGAVFELQWIRTKPRVSQLFAKRPDYYAKYGMKGHNGIDFGVPVGTPVYAAMDGEVMKKDSGVKGYGLHVKIRNPYKASESVYGHLSKVNVSDGARVNVGDLIGWTGNTGDSSGPHLHFGYRFLKPGDKNDLFSWEVMDYDNGYYGYFDPIDFLVRFKGSMTRNNL